MGLASKPLREGSAIDSALPLDGGAPDDASPPAGQELAALDDGGGPEVNDEEDAANKFSKETLALMKDFLIASLKPGVYVSLPVR